MSDILPYHTIEKIPSKPAPEGSQSRKALQMLQVSAGDQNDLVASPGTMPKKDKAFESKNKGQEKNKASLPRRSKRGKKNIKNEQHIFPHQSSQDSCISVVSMSSETNSATGLSESSMFSKKNTVLDVEPSMCMRVIKSVSDESDLLTSNVPTQEYWRQLAEQRRLAYEITAYENARIRDEIEVLGPENAMLRSALKEAEAIIETVKVSLE